LLDLKIRDVSENRRSLDDVMRALYRKYYQQKKRGFADAEFQQECEASAGGPLTEFFEYVATTKEIDYPKYFALAGLDIDVTPAEGKGAYLGLNVRMMEGKLGIASILTRSPAEKAGITGRDEILQAEGATATAKALNDALIARKPGDRLKLRLASREVEVELGTSPVRSFKIQPLPNPTPRQAAIYKDWLRSQ